MTPTRLVRGWVRIPFYGILVAPTVVLAMYGAQPASPHDLLRPLVVITLVAALAFVLIGGVTRRWHAAAMVVALGVMAVVQIELVLLALVWVGAAVWFARRTGSWGVTPKLTSTLNVLVAAWFVIAGVGALLVNLPQGVARPTSAQVRPGPNVYLILLDGYPRHDTLMEYFGFDNRPFLDALTDRGFAVAERSTSLYPDTIQTLATLMHMKPVDELLGEDWTGSLEQYRRLWNAFNDAPVPAAYEAAGYTTFSVVPPVPGHDWRTADVVMDSPWLSDFEVHLTSGGVLRFVLPYAAMQRAEILDAFRYLKESAGRSPRFVFAHVLSPHSPYAFAADGSPAEACGESCADHAGPPNPELGDRLLGQIEFLNRQVLEAVDHIMKVDPAATVFVLSDHGLRRDRADMDEWFRSLFAVRGPAFPEDASTSELFTVLLADR